MWRRESQLRTAALSVGDEGAGRSGTGGDRIIGTLTRPDRVDSVDRALPPPRVGYRDQSLNLLLFFVRRIRLQCLLELFQRH